MISVDPEGLRRLADVYNQRFNDFIAEENSLQINEVRALSGGRATVYYRCLTRSGKTFDRSTSVLRYSLWNILSELLPREEVGFRLYATAQTLTEVLMAIRQQTGILLTGEDVYIDNVHREYVQISCRPKSLGWYGSISLRVISP
jgi:hypothetical protein